MSTVNVVMILPKGTIIPKLDHPNNAFSTKSKFWKHNDPGLAILDDIDIL